MKEKKENLASHGQHLNINVILQALQSTSFNINELLKYSSRDFSSLNQKFLSFHKQNKQLIARSGELTGEFEKIEKNNHLEKHFTLEHIKEMDSFLKKGIKEFSNLKNKIRSENEMIDFILIPLNNYKQNLITLKLLSTNLKIDNSTNAGGTDELMVQSIIPVLENICMFFPKFQKYADAYKGSNTETSAMVNDFHDRFFNDSLRQLESAWDIKVNYFEKIGKNQNKINDFKNLKVENQEYVDTIITNLQYQDIIRQRIEHIQETHQELIDDLNNLNIADKNELGILGKIRDIVGLQSAQLIHINQEFQSAIENISDKIKEYNHHISDYNAEVVHFLKTFDIEKGVSRNLLISDDGLHSRKSDINAFIDHISRIKSNRDSNSDEFTKYLIEVFDINEKIKKVHQSVKAEKTTKTLQKIQSILSENLELFSKIEDNIKELDEFRKYTYSEYNTIVTILNKVTDVYDLFENSSIFSNLFSLAGSFLSLQTMVNISSAEQKELNKALHELEYYQFFESNVNEIITLLNGVNANIGEFVESNDIRVEVNLDYIRKRYTMEEEHAIHKNYTMAGMNSESSSAMDKEKASTDDDVEFF